MKRVVVSGGGTGGHIFPALAVIESLKKMQPDLEVLYIGSQEGMEARIVPEQGVLFQGVKARKLRKLISFSTPAAGAALAQGFLEARRYMRAFGAEAVLGTGGYVAAAAALAGVSLGLPLVICAPDAIPGRTNRLLARFARTICVAFEDTQCFFAADRVCVTGLPLRTGVCAPQEVTQAGARTRLGLHPDRFTLFAGGGSQGAQALNGALLEALPALLEGGVQVLHQTGARNQEEILKQTARLRSTKAYLPMGFLNTEQMSLAHRAADLAWCRGGISTLSEALVNKLPALVTPLPTAYADHQTANARQLERAGAVCLLAEANLGGGRPLAELQRLQNNEDLLVCMRNAAEALARPNAADSVAELLLNTLQ